MHLLLPWEGTTAHLAIFARILVIIRSYQMLSI